MIEAAGQLRETLALVAPGTVLRDGLERILRGRTGAIIVLGFDPVVEAISSGGFHLDVELSAARLRELAKMDGGVVVDMDTARIRRANVQLLPNASIQTSETGMRHRTAERVARQTGYPVISVSQSMRIISLYVDGKRHVLEPSESILASANQALSALERYKARLDQTSAGLDSLEIEDLVTVRDVTSVLQLMEMVRRISDDIDSYVLELGTDGRLLALQVEELTRGLLAEHGFLLEDYLPEGLDTATVDARLKWVGSPALLDLAMVARSMGLGGIDGQDLDAQVSPRGLRILSKIPRLPVVTARAVVEQQFEIAERIIAAGLVPIIEPEVDIHATDKAKAEELLVASLTERLDALSEGADVMLKVSIPTVDGLYSELMRHPRVMRVVALSGGYEREDANARLARNPGLIASFSRALLEGLSDGQSQEEFDAVLAATAESVYEASIA